MPLGQKFGMPRGRANSRTRDIMNQKEAESGLAAELPLLEAEVMCDDVEYVLTW